MMVNFQKRRVTQPDFIGAAKLKDETGKVHEIHICAWVGKENAAGKRSVSMAMEPYSQYLAWLNGKKKELLEAGADKFDSSLLDTTRELMVINPSEEGEAIDAGLFNTMLEEEHGRAESRSAKAEESENNNNLAAAFSGNGPAGSDGDESVGESGNTNPS